MIAGPYAGAFDFSLKSSNKLILKQIQIPAPFEADLEYRILPAMLEALNIPWDTLRTEAVEDVQENFLQEIATIRDKLSTEKVRVLPISTFTLAPLLNLEIGEALGFFKMDLKAGLQQLGFAFINQAAASQGIEQDLINNDIPIFYFCPADQLIFYHNEVIATREQEIA